MSAVREKAHRLPRTAYQGEVTASFTLCVTGRVPLFVDPRVVADFHVMLERAAARRSCLVPAYCFMPDHLHVVLRGTSKYADLWKAIVDFKQATGFWLSRNRSAISWQKDFHDHVIRRDQELAAHIRYVLENPCRKGIVVEWEEYPFKGAIGCSLEDVLMGLLW